MIVTLSSIPPRFSKIGPTLESLLAQQLRPEKVHLYIPQTYRRFSDWDGTLPKVPEGVVIHRVDEDLGPATKVLYATREFSNTDILFCDDDRAYPTDWTQRFANLRRAHPDAAIALVGRHAETMTDSRGKDRFHPRAIRRWRITDWRFQLHFLMLQILAGRNWRAVPAPHRRVYKRSGFIDIFEGCGGVMVRPEMFDDVSFRIPPVLWAVDDVWLSGMVARAGVPIWLEANNVDPPETEADATEPLAFSVIEGANRDEANALAVKYMQEHFGIWR